MTDENQWERAVTQFSNKRISIGRKFKNCKFRERIRTLAILGKRSIQPKDQKVNTRIKKQDDYKDPATRRRKQETMDKFRTRIIVQ